jgi:hypothetical protein
MGLSLRTNSLTDVAGDAYSWLTGPGAHSSSYPSDFGGYLPQDGVGIAMGYGLDGPGLIPDRERFFSFPQSSDRPWGPTSLLSNGYRGLFPQGKVAGA